MKRCDGRKNDELRRVKVTKNFLKHAEGSCLIEVGHTKVICSASVEESVPSFLKGKGAGWVTAEYGMLPRSCTTRLNRDKSARSGRTLEIQRLVGRSLRSVVRLDQLGERTIFLDCDVIQADGGTRCASITGSFIALAQALGYLKKKGILSSIPLADFVAAVSVGVLKGAKVLDLNYEEDSAADVDMNVVMLSSGAFVEVQGTAERMSFSKKQLDDLLSLAWCGIRSLVHIQKQALAGLKIG